MAKRMEKDGRKHVTSLPTPVCKYGYSQSQIEEIMGPRLAEFYKWMRGQTGAICEGKSYNHDTRSYEVSCGGVSHGFITYPWDVERFLDGRPIED
jgi:hypothetical protein